MENNKNNIFLLENINKFKSLEELKDFQKLMNEACDNKAVELNVKNEAKNLEIPSLMPI